MLIGSFCKDRFEGTSWSTHNLLSRKQWSPIRSKFLTILESSDASHLVVPKLDSIDADSRIWPTCLSNNNLSASTSFSLSSLSSKDEESFRRRTSVTSLIWLETSRYILFKLEYNGISEVLINVTNWTEYSDSSDISIPLVVCVNFRICLLSFLRIPLLLETKILCAPEIYAPTRWSKRNSTLISSMFISIFLLFLTLVVSAFNLKLPEGRHSILILSFALSPCSVTHFLGRLTM